MIARARRRPVVASGSSVLDMRDISRLRKEIRQARRQLRGHASEHLILRTRGIYRGDRSAFGVRGLPRRRRAVVERALDLRVKRIARALDPISAAARDDARVANGRGRREQNREIGHEPGSRELVRRAHVIERKSAAHDLIRVRRQKEAIGEHELAARERRLHHFRDELRTRCHEQQRLGPRIHLAPRLEQHATNLVAKRGAAGLAHARVRTLMRGQPVAHKAKLRGLPRPFGPFEDEQPAARHGHASVMMELVAPFLMPSRIHSFTRAITFSKFSCDTTTFWYTIFPCTWPSSASRLFSISSLGCSPRSIIFCASMRICSIWRSSATASLSWFSASFERFTALYSALWPISRPSSFALSSSTVIRPFVSQSETARVRRGRASPRHRDTGRWRGRAPPPTRHVANRVPSPTDHQQPAHQVPRARCSR